MNWITKTGHCISWLIIVTLLPITKPNIHAQAINSLEIANTNTSLTMAASTQSTDVKLFDITINNNDPNGFTLSILSQNDSQLHHTTYNSSKTGTFISYTIDIQDQSGTLGISEPGNLLNQTLDDTTATTYIFSNRTADTVDLVYNIDITIPAKAGLFSGSYSDTLTLTLTNN